MTGCAVALASDHAGARMREALQEVLEASGWTIVDLGADGTVSVDYPDYADKLVRILTEGQAERGILICGSGIGMSIAANRYRHVRAALCHNSTEAALARRHNDANVLVLGARTMGPEVAQDCVNMFLSTEFEGGRHARRVEKLS